MIWRIETAICIFVTFVINIFKCFYSFHYRSWLSFYSILKSSISYICEHIQIVGFDQKLNEINQIKILWDKAKNTGVLFMRYYKCNPSLTENIPEGMTSEVLGHCVSQQTAATMFAVCDRYILDFHDEEFKLSVSFEFEQTISLYQVLVDSQNVFISILPVCFPGSRSFST